MEMYTHMYGPWTHGRRHRVEWSGDLVRGQETSSRTSGASMLSGLGAGVSFQGRHPIYVLTRANWCL